MMNHSPSERSANSATDAVTVGSFAIKPVEAPLQRERPFLAGLLQAARMIRANEARDLFKVEGAGTTIAVLDTGLRTTHHDFARRVAGQRNFTTDNGGDPSDASDGHGHGTNVAGIICGGGHHSGIASAARIIPLKVLGNDGGGDFETVANALQWVIDHRAQFGISALCLSFGNGGNHQSDAGFAEDPVALRIDRLADARVACCVAAGDDYYTHGSVQGMSYPAIVRKAISVGAVFDGDVGSLAHSSGAEAYESEADRITPFSQRLHEKVGRACATTVFAPGAPTAASGILSDVGASLQHGTSQATPIVAGIVLLLQSLHLRLTGSLPTVADMRRWLMLGAVSIDDRDDEHDNVLHTGLGFRRIDAVAALESCARETTREVLAASHRRRCGDDRSGAFSATNPM